MRSCSPSSSKFAQAIELRFSRSLPLWAVWIGVHLVMGCLVWSLQGLLLRTVALLLVLASMASASRLPGVGLSHRALISVTRHDDGSWTLIERSGRVLSARLESGFVVGSRLIFVTWITAGEARSAVLLPGLVSFHAMRRMRVLLATTGRT